MGDDEETEFNMNDWKNFYSNNPHISSHEWLCQHYSDKQCLYVGGFHDDLPILSFMRSNLIKGFYQALDNKLHRNAFGTGILRDDRLSFVFLFDGIEMPELFKDSSLHDSCIWTKAELDQVKYILYPDLFTEDGDYEFFVYK